ncbi:hypothetical protein [Rhodoferax antarcticus]|uniref:hypothetical protein n=1 Tax=Rhodoferax antarcticus TaxID=81479 RepID=UPI00094FE1C2|nr:hypothetical protein [Rhodoferax antarcticus]
MANDESTNLVDINQPSADQKTFALAWVGYFAVLPIVIFYILIMVGAFYLLNEKDLGSAIYGVYAFGTISIIYEIALIRSVKLIINDNGVWAIKGVLPWKKSCIGLQWRNIGIAAYQNNLYTWIFKAYRINVEDRYTGKVEMSVPNISDGKTAVSCINMTLAEKHST